MEWPNVRLADVTLFLRSISTYCTVHPRLLFFCSSSSTRLGEARVGVRQVGVVVAGLRVLHCLGQDATEKSVLSDFLHVPCVVERCLKLRRHHLQVDVGQAEIGVVLHERHFRG